MRTFVGSVGLGFGAEIGSGSVDAPVITGVTDNEDGTATIALTGAGTIQSYYRILYTSAWTTGLTRSGSGNIVQTGLTQGKWYEFYCTDTVGGVTSGPSNIVVIYVATASEDDPGSVDNYMSTDTAQLLELWKETVTVSRDTETYSSGMATHSWATVCTIDGDFQDVDGKTVALEASREVKTMARFFCERDQDIEEDDRVTRSNGVYMYVNYVIKHEDHWVVHLKRLR